VGFNHPLRNNEATYQRRELEMISDQYELVSITQRTETGRQGDL
jgi:hypothetical protein